MHLTSEIFNPISNQMNKKPAFVINMYRTEKLKIETIDVKVSVNPELLVKLQKQLFRYGYLVSKAPPFR